MLNHRRLPAVTRSVPFALFAAATLISGAASADGPGPGLPEAAGALGSAEATLHNEPVASAGEVPSVGHLLSDVEESAWDFQDKIVVDAQDELDEGAIGSLASAYGLAFHKTALEAETKIELADVKGMSSSGIASLLAKLRHDPRVHWAEPLARVEMFFVPNDPLMKSQWHLERIGTSRAWDFATGRGVTVAVVDTGIACEDYGPFVKSTDLATTECVPGWNVAKGNEHANDDQGHGTHVAGTIAQSTNNGLGAAGVAFHAKLMPVKVLNENGFGTTADVADGIRWAAEHGAQVINLSLGGPRNSKVLQEAIDFAIGHGAVVVAAAGNTGGHVQFPGASDGVIGVSATDADDKIAKFSSRGDGVDIAAPGVNVVQQTICDKGHTKCDFFPAYSGTSMASPHVAGAAALLVGLGVSDPVAVEEALRKSARTVDSSPEGVKLYGAGILQAAEAVSRVTTEHVIVRLLALFGLTLLIARGARKKNAEAARPTGLRYWIPALAAGPGLFFFAPWVLPRVHIAVDVLSRPLADLDFFLGASVHRFLPFANALLPFALTAVAFGAKRIRPAIAGLAAGTGAYLTSVAVLGEAAGPMGRSALMAWCALNVFACAWIARTNLAETK